MKNQSLDNVIVCVNTETNGSTLSEIHNANHRQVHFMSRSQIIVRSSCICFKVSNKSDWLTKQSVIFNKELEKEHQM